MIIGQTPVACNRTTQDIFVWSPIGFDPSEWIPPRLHQHGDCARYLLHRVHYGNVFGQRNRRGFVPLMATELRKFFPTRSSYKSIRDALLDSGAIACDDHFIKGEKAMGYSLGPRLEVVRQHRFLVTDEALAWKIRDSRQSWIKAPDDVHKHLLGNLRRLEIDYDAALQWLLQDDDFKPEHETAAQLIRDRQWHFHVCDYGRVHTNVTNLRSSLRRFLTIDGQHLVNLDVRNSQPLLFGLILMNRYGPRHAMPDDARRYIDLCQEGRFYDHLMALGGIPAAKRSVFKRKFFANVFFCGTRYETDAAKLFGQLFPSVYKIVLEQKTPDYAALSKNLQRVESDLIIGKVASRLMRESPTMPIVTIHDSIMTTPVHAEMARQIMLQEFNRAGLCPSISVDKMGNP